MLSGRNKMDKKSDDQLRIIQARIEANRQNSYDKMKNIKEDLTAMIASMMDQIKISKSSLEKKDPTKSQDPTTVVPSNKKDPPLEGGHSTKDGGMWTLKHETISPKFYELPIKTQLKVDTDMDLKNFYNYNRM